MASHTPHMICILVIKYTSLPIYIFGVFILYCGFRPRRVKIDFLSQTTMMVIRLRPSSLPPKRPFSLSFSLVLRSQMWKYYLKFFLHLVQIIKQLLLLCVHTITKVLFRSIFESQHLYPFIIDFQCFVPKIKPFS